uniref:Uncharacterized protein n=1 Tax=Coprothermobacter proteolyticus (strain ATCC 35245 / DSM 5265 / OCM 4 / BT) TaxID=309798 RepID=B5Y813_COPPD
MATTMVMPSSANSFITSKTSLVYSGSRAEVGSSNKITSGSMASALAIATLCFWPPDKDEGRAFAFSAKPTRCKISMAWASASWGDLPKTFMGPMVTF